MIKNREKSGKKFFENIKKPTVSTYPESSRIFKKIYPRILYSNN